MTRIQKQFTIVLLVLVTVIAACAPSAQPAPIIGEYPIQNGTFYGLPIKSLTDDPMIPLADGMNQWRGFINRPEKNLTFRFAGKDPITFTSLGESAYSFDPIAVDLEHGIHAKYYRHASTFTQEADFAEAVMKYNNQQVFIDRTNMVIYQADTGFPLPLRVRRTGIFSIDDVLQMYNYEQLHLKLLFNNQPIGMDIHPPNIFGKAPNAVICDFEHVVYPGTPQYPKDPMQFLAQIRADNQLYYQRLRAVAYGSDLPPTFDEALQLAGKNPALDAAIREVKPDFVDDLTQGTFFIKDGDDVLKVTLDAGEATVADPVEAAFSKTGKQGIAFSSAVKMRLTNGVMIAWIVIDHTTNEMLSLSLGERQIQARTDPESFNYQPTDNPDVLLPLLEANYTNWIPFRLYQSQNAYDYWLHVMARTQQQPPLPGCMPLVLEDDTWWNIGVNASALHPLSVGTLCDQRYLDGQPVDINTPGTLVISINGQTAWIDFVMDASPHYTIRDGSVRVFQFPVPVPDAHGVTCIGQATLTDNLYLDFKTTCQ